MKIGSIVKHPNLGLGRVLEFMERNPGVLVDFSDSEGVRCRWVHKNNIEVVNEK